MYQTSSQKDTPNRSYYAIIPADVRYCKTITDGAKLLYGEITALCNEKGYCWASNAYFAELYNNSTNTISRWISELQREGFIITKIDADKGNARQIWIVPEGKSGRPEADLSGNPIPKNNDTLYPKTIIPLHKNGETSPQNWGHPLTKNGEYNNTFNNTENNTVTYTRNEEKTDAEGGEESLIKPATDETKRKRKRTAAATASAPPVFPAHLNAPAFFEVWELWRKHRTEIRKPLKPTSEQLALDKLAKDTSTTEEAVLWVKGSIAAGWQGIYAPKVQYINPAPQRNYYPVNDFAF